MMRVDDATGLEQALGELLVEQGKLDAAGLARALRLAEPADFPDVPVHGDRVSVNFLKQAHVLPLAETEDGLAVAMADPLDRYTVGAMQLFAGKPVQTWVAAPGDVEAAIERLYGRGGSIGEIVQAVDPANFGAEDDVRRLRDLASEAPVVRIVSRLITKAVEARASDIHIEPFEQTLRVRYRIDGALRDAEAPPAQLGAAIISRIKIMARLDIAERRLPQDGRIKVAVRGKDIDLRVATMPAMHGEAVVLRVLDRSSVTLDFIALGFEAEALALYRQALARPNGIILVTGFFNDAATNEIYNSLTELNTPDRKILTVEDPIEYQLDGVNQVQVKPQIGLSFAHILRSMLRHDPDVIMVGEIRDLETAQIAIQAALTGHLVLSTLHTNNAASTLTRLLDMGVEDYLMTSTLNAIVAQRLVRRLCRDCFEAYRPLPEMLEQLGLEGREDVTFWRPVGCPRCNETGYYGRISINEVLVMSDPIRKQILHHAEATELQRVALAAGMRPMFQDGVAKAAAGVTTIEEVLRVTREVE